MKLETRQIMFGVILTMPFSCYLFNQWLVTDETEKREVTVFVQHHQHYTTVPYHFWSWRMQFGRNNTIPAWDSFTNVVTTEEWDGNLGQRMNIDAQHITRIINLYDQFKLSIVMALFRVICWALVFILHECCNTSLRHVSFNRIHHEEKSNQL